MDVRNARLQAAELLKGLPETATACVAGFDGFIDHIIDVVDARQGPDAYTPMATISDFGARISAAAGHSTNFELVTKQSKFGGNGPLMANGLASLGQSVTYIGLLGPDEPLQAFAPFIRNVHAVINLGGPASTDALEFRDGKIMLGKVEPLNAVSVASLKQRVGEERLRKLFVEARCVASVNWTMILAMNEIWDYLCEEILPARGEDRPLWFVDLADPAKRGPEDLRGAFAALGRLQGRADVALGLNEAETRQALAAIGADWEGESEDLASAEKACQVLQRSLGISRVVCHMVKGAASCGPDGSAATQGFYEPNPKITTGAGDHFNAGYFWSVVAGCDELTALLVGTATSGFYVRNVATPNRKQLIDILSSSPDL